MDSNTIRERLISGFRPKQEDVDTPYLEGLEQELRFVGLSAQDVMRLRKMATVQTGTTDENGNLINELDNAKYTGLMLIRCLYSREDGKPIFDQLIPTQGPMAGNAADLQAMLGMEAAPFNQLVEDLNKFLGTLKTAIADAKKNSETPQQAENDSSSSSLPENSNGSDPSTN